MLIIGYVSSKEETKEMISIAKLFILGQRARHLAREACQQDILKKTKI